MKIIVFRKLSASDRRALKPHRVFSCPAFKIVKRSLKIPPSTFDYVLVTSANALRFTKRRPSGKNWIVMGESTRKALRIGRREMQVLRESHSEGVIRFFSRSKRGSIFFPRSKIADRGLPAKLRKLGYRVTVRHTYDTKILPVRVELLKLLKHEKIEAFFLTSPSSFEALRKSFTVRELRSFKVTWVAIGPTTASALRAASFSPLVAKEPSLAAMLMCSS